jgi:hypothetical protein
LNGVKLLRFIWGGDNSFNRGLLVHAGNFNSTAAGMPSPIILRRFLVNVTTIQIDVIFSVDIQSSHADNDLLQKFLLEHKPLLSSEEANGNLFFFVFFLRVGVGDGHSGGSRANRCSRLPFIEFPHPGQNIYHHVSCCPTHFAVWTEQEGA